ncbi:MAG: hypothetical protein M1283_04265 [Gammaproteobacteria bacterium]|nr:hypothetical protein [Gammaproteobacteria bacterium]
MKLLKYLPLSLLGAALFNLSMVHGAESPAATSQQAAPASLPYKWQNISTRAKVMSIAFEGDYLWLGLNGGVIRHDLRTYKDHELYTVQNTHGGLMSPGVYKIAIYE